MTECKRCGDPITGIGKTGMCQPCASHFSGMKRIVVFRSKARERSKKSAMSAAISRSYARRDYVPITLAGTSLDASRR